MVPDPPAVTVTKPLVLVALQVQPGGVTVTRNEPDPPPATAVAVPGLRLVTQGAPSSVMGNVWLPTAILPDRTKGVGFAAALYFMVPVPGPPDAVVTVIQSLVVVPFQVQVLGVGVTVKEPDPPPKG